MFFVPSWGNELADLLYKLQVLGPSWFDCWPVCLRCTEADQAQSRESYLHFCQEHSTTNWLDTNTFPNHLFVQFKQSYLFLNVELIIVVLSFYCSGHNVCDLWRAQRRRWLSIHELQWREHIRYLLLMCLERVDASDYQCTVCLFLCMSLVFMTLDKTFETCI